MCENGGFLLSGSHVAIFTTLCIKKATKKMMHEIMGIMGY